MNSLVSRSAIAIATGTVLAANTGAASAATFDPSPTFDQFASYSTVNPINGDATDIYYPTLEDSSPADDLPIALLLQGALVDKAAYSNYASQVARYGFAVVVPNHTQTVPGLGEVLAPETSQLQAVLDQLTAETADANSPLSDSIDTQKLGLLGHSLGGSVGLSAIGEICLPGLCPAPFERPEELVSGVFFGANLRDTNDVFLPIENDGIGVALIQGNQDGRALPFRAELTYDQIQTPPRALVTLDGVNHFGITDVNRPIGAIPDPQPQTLEQDVAIETVARWSGLFLRGTVLDDPDAFDYVFNTGAALDPNVVSVEAEAQPVPEPMTWAGIGVVSLGLFWRKRYAS